LVRLSIRVSSVTAWNWFACQNYCHTGFVACRTACHAALNLNLSVKKTRKQVFLEQIDQVVPRANFSRVDMLAACETNGTSRQIFGVLLELQCHLGRRLIARVVARDHHHHQLI
jgi:hypothetical protein